MMYIFRICINITTNHINRPLKKGRNATLFNIINTKQATRS